jgi:hypothetical protein
MQKKFFGADLKSRHINQALLDIFQEGLHPVDTKKLLETCLVETYTCKRYNEQVEDFEHL